MCKSAMRSKRARKRFPRAVLLAASCCDDRNRLLAITHGQHGRHTGDFLGHQGRMFPGEAEEGV